MDEPTAYLDIGHQIAMLDLVKKLNRTEGLTVVMILHDLNLASEYCEKLLLMDNGRTYTIGTPKEVLTYENIEQVYKTVVVVEENPFSHKPYVIAVSGEYLQMKLARTIMIQGTGSGVGKSVIVSALCRIFNQDGYNVAPYKAQNMALNSFVTPSGGEIGRAQAAQAQAARVIPTVDMNPVLIKPSSDTMAQIIVLGKPVGNRSAMGYMNNTKKLFDTVKTSLQKLRQKYDIVVMEGAGSPAEVNLRKKDIVI